MCQVEKINAMLLKKSHNFKMKMAKYDELLQKLPADYIFPQTQYKNL